MGRTSSGSGKKFIVHPAQKNRTCGSKQAILPSGGGMVAVLALCKAQRSRHTPWAVVLDIFAGEGTHPAAKTKSGQPIETMTIETPSE